MSIVVKYGSSARGDSDSFSDCDFLVVGVRPEYIENGSDIVWYTKNRLMNLRKNNSLFLVHLRDEGVIIEDDNKWMENFLNNVPNFVPNKRSLQLSRQNLSIALSLIPTKQLLECWYDIVFVFLRDYLIKLNASNQRYIYSIDNLLNYIDVKNKSELKSILRISREIKFKYRNGITQDIFIDYDWTSDILKKSLRLEAKKYSFNQIVNNKIKYDSYLILRLVEYKLIEGSAKVKDPDMQKYIKNPSLYSWNIKNIQWNEVVETVEHLEGPRLSRHKVHPVNAYFEVCRL